MPSETHPSTKLCLCKLASDCFRSKPAGLADAGSTSAFQLGAWDKEQSETSASFVFKSPPQISDQLFHLCRPMSAIFVTVFPSSSYHSVEGSRSFLAVHRYTSILAHGGASGPCCSSLTSTIHMCFDIFGPIQPQYMLLPTGLGAASCWRAAGATHTDCLLLPQATAFCLTVPPLWGHTVLFSYWGNACWFVYSCLKQPPDAAAAASVCCLSISPCLCPSSLLWGSAASVSYWVSPELGSPSLPSYLT